MLRAISLGWQLARADIKLRHEGSYLGILWYLLNPILIFVLLYAAFNRSLGASIEDYPLYLATGIVMFNIFQSSTTEASRSISQENHRLIKAIPFPAHSIVLSILIRNGFSYLIEMVILCIIATYAGDLSIYILLLPVLIIFMLVFSYGISLILSAWTVFLADLDNLWLFSVRLLWFTTPIFYSLYPGTAMDILNRFNPLSYFITYARSIIIYGQPPPLTDSIGIIVFSIIALACGTIIFGHASKKFAESI